MPKTWNLVALAVPLIFAWLMIYALRPTPMEQARLCWTIEGIYDETRVGRPLLVTCTQYLQPAGKVAVEASHLNRELGPVRKYWVEAK